jgi:formamidopyrimidine-DNA glycosylase
VREVIIRQPRLRQPVTPTLADIEGRRITAVSRRAKYLLFAIADGSTVLVHLGMSGSLRLTRPRDEWRKHDHLALALATGRELRFHDPRRFGLVLHVTDSDPLAHPLLRDLGPEPLGGGFSAEHLAPACARRCTAIKTVIMDHRIVVGVGNIYASEALFHAGIHPLTPAKRLRMPKLRALTDAIRTVLAAAIDSGGTTLRDFVHGDGRPGHFAVRLAVYGRTGDPCRQCGAPIRHAVVARRSTYWCPSCQPRPRSKRAAPGTLPAVGGGGDRYESARHRLPRRCPGARSQVLFFLTQSRKATKADRVCP